MGISPTAPVALSFLTRCVGERACGELVQLRAPVFQRVGRRQQILELTLPGCRTLQWQDNRLGSENLEANLSGE